MEPRVADDEIEQILDESLLARIWEAETEYEVGAVVVPTAPNGHRYQCIQAGESGESEDEPVWPDYGRGIVPDGEDETQIVWQEAGPTFASLYDVRAAIHAVWMLKASKVSHLHDSRRSQSSASRSQIYDHCVKQAERFRPIRTA